MVVCELCPKTCRIDEGRTGDCGIRANIDGKLRVLTYGYPCSVHIDPIEKKPLFHFLPGSKILSIATVGCNMECRNCQNWTISQAKVEETEAYSLPPEDVAALAVRESTPSVAYTYSEPLAWYEYTFDCSQACRQRGVRNVLVTAGYINEAPLRELLPKVQAANVDLKSFSDEFYRTWCSGSLAPVLRTLKLCKEYGVWLEVTNLLIPGQNDADSQIRPLLDWHLEHLGPATPLHFSKFHPLYKAENLAPTPAETLERARQLALQAGLKHVYVGNIRSSDGENTFCSNAGCPGRSRALIEREGFTIVSNRLSGGKCPDCGTALAGVWS